MSRFLLGLVLLCWLPSSLWAFSGERALDHIQTQVDFGPRYPTSMGHQHLRLWLARELSPLAELAEDAWKHQDAHGKVYDLKNLIFRFQPQRSRRLILGAHYDSRRYADKDEADPKAPLVGANDSASGVALLVELARHLPEILKEKDFGVDLVFFDAEEGELDPKARPWQPLGSIHFAQNLTQFYPQAQPELGIVVDMVCDKDLQLYFERFSLSSAPQAVWKLWQIGAKHHRGFKPQNGYRIFDDHYPLIKAGVPALVIIDFDYPAWHTTKDQIDQCSATSLDAVGETLVEFLRQY